MKTVEARSPSLLARALEPIAAGLTILFYLWSGLAAVVWGWNIGEVELQNWIANPALRAALQWIVGALDLVWISLAGVILYRDTAATEGLNVARRWALIVFFAALAIAWLSVRTGFPLGPIHYTSRLGPAWGPVPLGVPILWIVIIFGARAMALRLRPRLSHGQLALFTGALSAATLLNLEPIAWKTRSWWLWYPGNMPASSWPPATNYLTWLLAATLLAWVMRSQIMGTVAKERPSWIVFAVFNALILFCHALHLG